MFALAALCACKVNPDDQVVAIQVTLPDSGRVEVTDSFFPSARALNGSGDSLPATILWSALDPAVLPVLDSTTGVSFGDSVGTGRLQARIGALRTLPQPVKVVPRLESMAAAAPLRDTLDVTPTDSTTDSLSNPLKIGTVALGGNAVGRRAVFTMTTYPASGPQVTLVPNDTVPTLADGTASVQVRFVSSPVPDSVVVTATMRRFDGTQIPGSPVIFVVEFRP